VCTHKEWRLRSWSWVIILITATWSNVGKLNKMPVGWKSLSICVIAVSSSHSRSLVLTSIWRWYRILAFTWPVLLYGPHFTMQLRSVVLARHAVIGWRDLSVQLIAPGGHASICTVDESKAGPSHLHNALPRKL
jgi:hypothetical protein